MALTGTGSDIDIQISGDSDGLQAAIGNAIRDMSEFEQAVAGVGLALSALATEGIRRSVMAASDFQTAMADVEKVTDPETAREMNGAIREMAGELPLAHKQLAELAAQAGRMGAEGTAEVQEFTRVAAEMGMATELSVNQAGTALGKMSSALGEPLENVGGLADAINELSNNFEANSAEIVDSTQRSGQALRALGLESDQILGLAAAFNEVSPSSELAAQKMQQVSEAMMAPENVQMFAGALGVTSDEFVKMRDKSPEQTMLALMNAVDDGTLSWEQLSSQLSNQQARAFRDTSSSADRMREAMGLSNDAVAEGGSLAREVAVDTDTLSSRVQILKNRFENMAIAAGENLLPTLERLVDQLIGAVDWFEDINRSTGGWLGTLGLIATAIGGVATAAGVLIKAMGGIAAIKAVVVSATGIISTAIGALSLPITAVIAAVGLFAAAFATDFAGVRTHTMRVVNALRNALQPAFQWLADQGPPLFERIKTAVISFAERAEPVIRRVVVAIADGLIATIQWLAKVVPPIIQKQINDWKLFAEIISTSISFVKNEVIKPYVAWFREQWAQHGTEITQIVRDMWAKITKAYRLFDENVRPIINAIFGWILTKIIGLMNKMRDRTSEGLAEIKAFWNRWGDEIMLVAQMAFDAIKLAVETSFDALTTIIAVGLQLIQGDWKGAWNSIKDFLRRTLDRIIAHAQKWGPKLISWVSGLVEDVIGWFKDLASRLIGNSIIPEMFNAILRAAESFASDIVSKISQMVDRAVQKAIEWKNRTVQAVRTLKNDAVSKAGKLRDQVVNKVEELASSAIEKIQQFATDAVGEFKEMVTSAANGISSKASEVVGEVEEMVDDALEKATDISTDFKAAGEGLVEDFAQGIRNKIDKVTGAAQAVADAVDRNMPSSDAKEGPLSNISKYGPAFVDEVASGLTGNLRQLERAADAVAGTMLPDVDPSALANAGATRAASGGGTTSRDTIINVDIGTVEASSRREGREAGRAIIDEIRSGL